VTNLKNTLLFGLLLVITFSFFCCESDEFGDEFPKSITVFGVSIVGSEKLDEDKILHAAIIMAQYLDNDEDGIADNQVVVDKLVSLNATQVMHEDEDDQENGSEFMGSENFQDLMGFETHPEFRAGQYNSEFDATLEEVLHLISSKGYAEVYPEIWGEWQGTSIANLMDIARGSYFETIPNEYPENAWYTYTDETCDYGCMVTEYFYWSLTTFLGAQNYPGREEDIAEEWSINTSAELLQVDQAMYDLLFTPEYKIPTVLPDNEYNGFEIYLD